MSDLLASLRIKPMSEAVTEELVQPIKIRKSLPVEFFQSHPKFSLEVHGFNNLFGEKNLHILTPQIAEDFDEDSKIISLHLCKNKNGDFFFYPLVHGKYGSNPWYESAHEGLVRARSKWVRIFSGNGQHNVKIANNSSEIVDWTDVEDKIESMLTEAIKPILIESHNHLVIKRLKGEL